MSKTILIIEDELKIRFLLRDYLKTEGFNVLEASDGDEGLFVFKNNKVDLILLDIMLPEEDGLQILKKLRATASTSGIPVMMLTAKGSEYDKVIGLDLGADDYLPKPFGMMELVARVKALLRRTDRGGLASSEEEYCIGSLYVCPSRHVVKAEGEAVALTLKEFEILCMLLRNRGKVLTRDMLLNEVWGYSFDGENRTVDVHIRTLRQKLGSAGELIETIRGIGYKIGGAADE